MMIPILIHMMYSALKLNKQGDSIQPWHTPFPIWNQSVVLRPVLTFASWPAYRILKRQIRRSGGSAGKESACNVGDLGSIPWLGGSPGEWNGYPFQYLGLENSINQCCPWITHKYSSPTFQFPPFHLEPSIYLVSPLKLDREVDLQTRFLLLHSLATESSFCCFNLSISLCYSLHESHQRKNISDPDEGSQPGLGPWCRSSQPIW